MANEEKTTLWNLRIPGADFNLWDKFRPALSAERDGSRQWALHLESQPDFDPPPLPLL